MGAIKEYYFDEIVEGLGKSDKTVNEYLDCKKIQCRIDYYQEKIDQWYQLQSYGEDYGELDEKMVRDWESMVKSLKEELEKKNK